ncbi:MAG TPA: SusC/RagA family TonB-linked outer membrane protein, partial [Arachidicoccus soli]|nr:SusC/RagA family TonB-linked outer membrane protein [Arachidicoccus soli]
FSTFGLRLSYGKFGKLYNTDRYSQGPAYVVDASWPSDPHIGSYVGIATATRPYTQGWVGYGIGWQYSNKANVGIDLGFFKNRLLASFDLYNTDDKNLLLPIPVPEELGYSSAYQNGMSVNNKGIDVSISGKILENEKSLNWTTTLNFNVNKNKLTALPGGLTSLIIGNRKLEVGKSIDAFWLYQNNGIYNTISDIPVNSKTGLRESFNGVMLNAGDPKWKDVNGDYDINSQDKVLMGHYLPVLTGGFGNNFNYRKFSLNFQFYFALGQKLLNQQIANHFDFVNNDNSTNLSSVKEITFWEKTFNPSDYPIYNPWSSVVPYQSDQNLFLQNASYVKLRAVSFGYDFSGANNGFFSKKRFKSILLYISATNVFTISPFKNGDPELVDYLGNYTGYNQGIPKTYTVGIKLGI